MAIKASRRRIHLYSPQCSELRELMHRSQINVRELARRTYLSEGAISQYRQGHKLPSLETMTALRQAIAEYTAEQNSDAARRKEELTSLRKRSSIMNRILEEARSKQWTIAGLHNDRKEELGLILAKSVVHYIFLTDKRYNLHPDAEQYICVLKEAGENVHIFRTNDYPALERILNADLSTPPRRALPPTTVLAPPPRSRARRSRSAD